MSNLSPRDEDVNQKGFTPDGTYIEKIGSTTYTVTRKYKKDAKEALMDKLIRLMKNDIN